jgi:hypothetical protein
MASMEAPAWIPSRMGGQPEKRRALLHFISVNREVHADTVYPCITATPPRCLLDQLG